MYMAPEQLEGQEADVRSDLWSFGATLYEMATGKPAFEGRSQASLIAAILGKEPAPIADVAPLSPPGLDRWCRRAWRRIPDDRIQTAHDAKLQLKWIAEGGSQAGVPAPIAAQRRRRERGAWILAGVSTAVALGTLRVDRDERVRAPSPHATPCGSSSPSPPGTNGITWPRLSPDGTMLAFTARDTSGTTSIWVRPLASTSAYMLAGTALRGGPSGRPTRSRSVSLPTASSSASPRPVGRSSSSARRAAPPTAPGARSSSSSTPTSATRSARSRRTADRSFR
jgi:serine/threonine protein kinase